MKIVATWSGEGFRAKQVQALARQVERFAPLDDFVCLTRVNVPGVECKPLVYAWPGWWVKYELFRPDIRGSVLYLDLDTVITGSLSDVVAVDKLTLLRDFYRDGKTLSGGLTRHRTALPEGLQASLMLLTEDDRAEIWEDWIRHPHIHMQELGRKGDQPMLEKHFLKRAQRWQDIVPGQIVSWKVNCCGGNEFQTPVIPADARVIIFHGTPRPWDVPQFKGLYV